MVYLNGHEFVRGDVFPFNDGPDYLLDRDVVLVTVNYRLGILGFLSTGDEAAPGNFGIRDQIMALQWVQRNIKSFEGDPERVTLLGSDTGAICVHFLATLSQSQGTRVQMKIINHTIQRFSGLFHQYILHGGTMLSPLAYRNSTTYPRHAKKVAEILECSRNDTESTINCMRNVSLEKLIMKPEKIFNAVEIAAMRTWGPTLDSMITEYPRKIFQQTPVGNIPFILGVVTNQGSNFISS